MKNLNLLPVFAALILFVSCDSDDTPETDDPITIVEKNDCVTYSPSDIGPIVINGNWSEANERDLYENAIVINDDVGGGYVNVVLSQSDPDLRPWLTLDNNRLEGGALIASSSATTNNEYIREASFSVYPGESYSIEVHPFFNADQYPVDYTITWEFFSKMDCFEPNDELAQAKKILLDETIEAYAIAGHRDYFVSSLAPQTFDWYKIELDAASIIEAEVLDMPNDMSISMRLINLDGFQEGTDLEWINPGDEPYSNGALSKVTSSRTLEPGTYFIELHSNFVKSYLRQNDTEPLPDHFNKTYKIKVSRK